MITTCGEALAWGTKSLHPCGIETARLDAEVLLAQCLGCERTALYGDPAYELTSVEVSRFMQLVARRGAHEPLAYLTGSREFWSLPLAVQPGVLIPRPETEFVVEATLRYAPRCLRRGPHCRLLDVGTGSGNIAIAVATSLTYASIVAIDIASEPLKVAQANAWTCGVSDRITYIQSDLLSALNPRRVRFDLLLSNPPYIAATEWASLPETVRSYEPHGALDGGFDGLLFYRRLIAEGPPYLHDGSFAIVEVGERQAGQVCRLFAQSTWWQVVDVIKDYSGVERVVVAQCTRGGEWSSMDQIEIQGGVPLRGRVRVSGAKNAVLPILASTLLTAGETRLRNVPRVRDVTTFTQVLQSLGAEIRADQDELLIDTSRVDRYEAPYELVKTMRASFLVLGPLLARMGRARVSLPGGCAIGARPVNLHLEGLRALGAHIELEHGYVHARGDQLYGSTIAFPTPTVTGTENVMMTAALAGGVTTIENAAREPEVVNLADALNAMGARVSGAGGSCIAIAGVRRLEAAAHEIIPDRIEGGTFLVAGAITGGEVTIEGCVPEHLSALLHCLGACGASVEVGHDWVHVKGIERAKPADIATAPHPGFPTDMQAQVMALLTRAEGQSVISETVFENRFMHAAELCRMGAEIRIDATQAVVTGVPSLHGAPVMATDLRASASLIIAGLAAKGITTISRVYHLDRGYERIEVKLAGLGAKIRRIP